MKRLWRLVLRIPLVFDHASVVRSIPIPVPNYGHASGVIRTIAISIISLVLANIQLILNAENLTSSYI